ADVREFLRDHPLQQEPDVRAGGDATGRRDRARRRHAMTRGPWLRVLLPPALLALTLTACSSNPKRPAARAGGNGSGTSWRDNTSLSQSKRYHHPSDST